MKTMMSKMKIVAVALACLMLGVLFFVGGNGEVKAEEPGYTFVTDDLNTEYAYVAVSGTDVSVGTVPQLSCVPDGYLFAGWFKTTACTSDDAVRTQANVNVNSTYYAKYVPEDVLSIRAQVSIVAGTDEGGNATRNIRFVSSVDSLAYGKVGFKLEFGDTTKYNNSTTVFERIESKTTGDEFTFSPKIIDTDSAYFMTATWMDVLETDTTGFYVRAYIKTLDGVVVYGPSRYVTVSDGLTTNQVIVPVKGTVEANAIVTYNDGVETRTASAVEVIDNANKDDDDAYSHVRITLAGVKKDLDSVTTFAVTGTNLTSKYRYPYTTYTGSGTEDTTWYNSTDDEFIIATSADLYGLANKSNQFTASDKIYVVSDIKINTGKATAWGTTAPSLSWTPISAFAGKFDGQGHTISGLYGKSNTEMGIFTSTANTAEIKNLKVTNSYFETSVLGLGTISGAGRGTFKKIYADAMLVGTGADASGNVGGILGAAKEGTVTIENCWSNCTIQSDGKRVGGIIGNATANAATVSIKHCLNTGTVTLKFTSGNAYRFYGGLVGSTGAAKDVDGISTFTMDDCLNLGTVSASGITNNCQGAISGEIGGTADITNTYYLEGVCTNPKKVHGNGSSTGTLSIEEITAAKLAGTNATSNTDLDFDTYWSPVYGAAPVLTTFVDDLDVLCVDTSWYNTTTKVGTITTRSQLYGFTALAASGKFDSSSKVYLGADITVNEGTAADWGTTAAKHQWTPISAFAGTFDGQGHTISGLYGKSTTAMGLFTATADSTVIQDLKVINSYFETSTHGLGTISGAGRGIFKNIYADATLVGTNQGQGVGGILGIAQATTVTIENCWSNCKINSDGKKVGGIIGSSNSNLATVSIKHCLNTGTITYTGKYTDNYVRFFGGLIGATGNGTTGRFTMDDCLNVGTVTVANGCINNAQGAILGQAEGSPTITNTYALNTSSTKMVGNGTASVTSKTIQQLEGEQATKTTALDFVNYWTTVTGSTPVLQSFVREEYLSNIDKFTPSWNYDFPEEMMSYENKVAALNAVGEDARMISVFHMGDTQHYAGNSLEALISAIQMGADVVEVDLCKTADGHIVLMHDATLSKYTDFATKNGVNGLPTDDDLTKWTLEQLRQLRLINGKSGYVITTLEEVLSVSNGRVKLLLDKIFDSNFNPVLDWDTDIYPIIEKTGAWDTCILPYQYNVTTQIAIADKLKDGAGDNSLNIHAFLKFTGDANALLTSATTLRNEDITPIAFWYTTLVTDTELTNAASALSTLKTSIRIMGQNHHNAGGTETSDMWDTLLNSGVNMVLADKGYDLQQYIATKFYATNQ